MKIRFVSRNDRKSAEVKRILGAMGVAVEPIAHGIEELQTEDVERMVSDKLIKAFEVIGRPLIVEHTALYLHGLNRLPGGLTQVFWDRLEADRFASLVAGLDDQRVTARTVIGYCDGRRLHSFAGEIEGTVPAVPAGPRDFQWDCVFIPDGHTQTFAEMGPAKDAISMRSIALTAFARHVHAANSST